MKYFTLKELDQIVQEPFDFQKIDLYISQVNDEDARRFLTHLKQPTAALMMSWIQQWPALENLLKDGKTSVPFSDPMKYSNHTLYPSFKSFVSPLLFPILSKNTLLKNPSNAYAQLLADDSRVVIEHQVNKLIAEDFEPVALALSSSKVNEDQLTQVVLKYLHQDNIDVLNTFSKSSYVHVIRFVENSFTVMESSGATTRLVNWMVKQLQQLELTSEHRVQLEEFREAVRSGEIQFAKSKDKRQFRFSSNAVYILLGLVAIASVLLILIKPWGKEVEEDELSFASSFEQFTPEERRKLDSLINNYQPVPMFNYELEDEEIYADGEQIILRQRKQLTNEKVKGFLGTWEDYIRQDSIRVALNCPAETKKIQATDLPAGFVSLKSKKKGELTEFINNSEYDLQVLIFNDSVGATAYFGTVIKGSKVETKLEVNDKIMLIPGKLSIPSPQASSKSIVFCDIDYATLEGLIRSYRFTKNFALNHQFVITGDNVYNFYLADLYNVLEIENN